MRMASLVSLNPSLVLYGQVLETKATEKLGNILRPASLRSDWVAALPRNRRPPSAGISGRNHRNGHNIYQNYSLLIFQVVITYFFYSIR
jgi:hypothetical protein